MAQWQPIQIQRENGEIVKAQAPIIVSASRSTDIPAFYADWFFHRLKVGYSAWTNPFNGVKSYVSYKNTRFIVFWSKNPRPLLQHLDYLKERNIGCYIQYTLNDYEKEGLEQGVPKLSERIDTFRQLVDELGKGRVIWRFDPLLLTDDISIDTLLSKIEYIGDQLQGYTEKLVFSYADILSYRKVKANLEKNHIPYHEWTELQMLEFAERLAELNKKWGYTLTTCGEKVDLQQYGIEHNHCVDDALIIRFAYEDKILMDFLKVKTFPMPALNLFGESEPLPKDAILLPNNTYATHGDNRDKGQRLFCGCIVSKDIGEYNTCPHLCEYCYANASKDAAVSNWKRHLTNKNSETITGKKTIDKCMGYINDIQRINNLSISDIIRVSLSYVPVAFKSCPWLYRDRNGRTLEHGTAVLETEEQCCAYMAAYGPMHHHKLQRALDENEFPYRSLSNGVEIYDWGCGQGIGTVAVIEQLRQQGTLLKLKKITLEEPSNVARQRAVLHVRQALGNHSAEIIDLPYYLPSDNEDNSNSITEIDVHEPCAIHIFSNILDIEAVSLKGVSKMITSSGSQHIALCIGPANLNESRINTFSYYFKKEGLRVFTEFRDVNFGRHPNGKAYGCLIKSFTYSLTYNRDILHKYNYFAPVQLFASYSDIDLQGSILQSAFEVLAPFDMTAHKNLSPVYALVSNLISRGRPTIASQKVLDAVSPKNKAKSLNAVARIQKTFVEAIISDRLDLKKDAWEILVIEDDTLVAKLALNDFTELYHHIVAITQDYSDMTLPTINIHSKKEAKTEVTYDAIIDVSIDQICNPEEVIFSKYKANNDCYFIVRSSKNVYAERFLYTTERIKYKPLVERDAHGNYHNIEEICNHLRYFLNLFFRKEDFRPGQLPILSRALQLKSVIGLLPTGGGKSLTYQLAAMLQPGVTLVVDPLKGLMKGQYEGLLKTGIDCISYINGDITKDTKERECRENALTGSQIQIMFLSPERLSIHRFREVLRSMRESDVFFAYGVIDEVHCVSEWGHDFRLAYLHLGRNLFNYVLPKEVEGEDNHISLFGLTATASFDVLADVERELSGSNSYLLEDDATVRYENTNRLELQYYIYPVDASAAASTWEVGVIKENLLLDAINNATEKIKEIQDDDCVKTIKKRFYERENIADIEKVEEINSTDISINVNEEWYSAQGTDTAGVVFCPRAGKENHSRPVTLSVPSVALHLKEKGIGEERISTFKGGDDTSCLDEFLEGETNLMVATKAFGMGIDKSNIRLTIHMNYPGSLESFVQEAGRAGRDKRVALATIMYANKKFQNQNIRTRLIEWHSADYDVNKFFYNANFLGEDFELFVMQMLLSCLPMKITNEEFLNIEEKRGGNSQGILQHIQKYPQDTRLTYYISYHEDESMLEHYNQQLRTRLLPIFETPSMRRNRNNNQYGYGYAQYKDAIQKAIYRMCVIGLIDDFTEDYLKEEFRIVSICQDESNYFKFLRLYYRKYYSEDRVDIMIDEVKQMAANDGVIMACLKHLTSFIYRSIADKRARGILDMEQFCNMAINSGKDWKETNEDLKDFIYYYFNSKYAREGFVTYDSNVNLEVPFSLKDDTNHDIHSENETMDFNIVKKYMRVVDPDIVNNDSQNDNIKHLQGAVRLIRRADAGINVNGEKYNNPVLNLLNIFCILFLGQQDNEMLEEELYNDYKAVMELYSSQGKLELLDEYTQLLIDHTALLPESRGYIKKIQLAVQLERHADELTRITQKYIES